MSGQDTTTLYTSINLIHVKTDFPSKASTSWVSSTPTVQVISDFVKKRKRLMLPSVLLNDQLQSNQLLDIRTGYHNIAYQYTNLIDVKTDLPSKNNKASTSWVPSTPTVQVILDFCETFKCSAHRETFKQAMLYPYLFDQ